MLCNATEDAVVVEINRQAKALMDSLSIPTINLHDAVVNKCGQPPQSSCFNHTNCFCPHCPDSDGYPWLASSTIVPAIKRLLEG